ncbi:hypothetical protein ACEQPO_10090 [Bacillus sp. SL00103]
MEQGKLVFNYSLPNVLAGKLMITDVNENRALQARNLGADVAFHPASEPVEDGS